MHASPMFRKACCALIAHREVNALVHLRGLEFCFKNFVAQQERVDEHARNVEWTFK